MLKTLFAEPSETAASSSDEEPDEADAATVTALSIGRLDLRIAEAATPFGATGADTTGGAVWAAAGALAELLETRSFDDETVLELGCGCALASVVAAKRGAATVVATDGSAACVRRAARSIALNGADASAVRFDWESCVGEDGGPGALRAVADVVVASDVIYGENCVGPLVAAIAHVAKRDAEILVVARDGRRGVDVFAAVARQAFFETAPPRRLPPPGAGRGADEAHTLFSFRNAPPPPETRLLEECDPGRAQCDLLADLDAKRCELAECRAEMAGLQDDLKDMAATVASDMRQLVAAFSEAMTNLANGDVAALEKDLDAAKLEEEGARADAAEEEAKLAAMEHDLRLQGPP